jgi:hypothetical protein
MDADWHAGALATARHRAEAMPPETVPARNGRCRKWGLIVTVIAHCQ